MSSSYVRSIGLEQNGSLSAGVWTDFAVGSAITVNPGSLVGLVYSLQVAGGSPFNMATSFSPARALDSPVWVTAGPITLTDTALFGGNLNLYLVPDPRPALFSTSNPPTTTGNTLLVATTLSIVDSPRTVTLDSTANATIREQISSKTTWTGRIAMVIDWQVGIATALTVSSMVNTTLQSFWSGLIGGPAGPRRRFVRDHRYAMPALNSELVRDSDQPSLWVRPWDADPFDEPNTYRPRPGEGTVDDDVGDL